jgi:alpha-beta hydrolase superfamily lysophospholipase
MFKGFKLALWLCIGGFAAAAAVVASLVAFGAEEQPETLASITSPFATMDRSGAPPIRHYTARDGAAIAFRVFPAGEQQAAVLIHGSAGSGADLCLLAEALQRIGITVYLPDLRGHGANLPHGDLAYQGQLDDDMADFIAYAKRKHPEAKWTLLGFSSGGGFTLRIAGSALGSSFDRYILVSPFLRYDAPTMRSAGADRNAGERAWARPFIKRIIGLMILNKFGVHRFDGLPVIAFAVPPDVASLTAAYSWRMLRNFKPHDDYRADIRAVCRPMKVFVGAADKLFVAEKFGSVFGAENRSISVTILPALGHSEMVTNPVAIHAIVSAMQSL